MSRRVIVCGDRLWWDGGFIRRTLTEELQPGDVVIHGDCRGADRIAGAYAEERGYRVDAYPALWDTYKKAAGPIRNRMMLKLGADLVLAFHDNLDRSKGTKDMVTAAMKAGVLVKLFGHKQEHWNESATA